MRVVVRLFDAWRIDRSRGRQLRERELDDHDDIARAAKQLLAFIDEKD